MKLPERWLQYTESGRIANTRFIAFKVPLREGYSKTLPPHNSFTPSKLLHSFPKLKLIIDLTFTTKYYNGLEEFETRGIKYVKLKCRGHEIPSQEIFKKFVKLVDKFIEQHPQDHLIGVHCTHGVNRTGYLIVRYMIENLGYTPDKALREFLVHRGHAIERTNYIADLKRKKSVKNGESGKMPLKVNDLESKTSSKNLKKKRSKILNLKSSKTERQNKLKGS